MTKKPTPAEVNDGETLARMWMSDAMEMLGIIAKNTDPGRLPQVEPDKRIEQLMHRWQGVER